MALCALINWEEEKPDVMQDKIRGKKYEGRLYLAGKTFLAIFDPLEH